MAQADRPQFLTLGRVLLLLALAAALAAFFLLGLHRYLRLEVIKDSRDWLNERVEAHFLLAILLFFLVYVAVSGLSIPVGPPALSLLGGFLFGVWLGTVAVSFGSTIGAALAFLSSRYLFRDFVQQRFARWWSPINYGLEKDGPFYLFTLRLVPIVPFTAVNLVLGLTRMPLWTFWWVSQLGMLPGTAIYVYTGQQLGTINSASDVLSPGLWVALALLGVGPLVFRWALTPWRRR
jgi:uncharacterized membrane protein YdjX (TVP38/TMEM64 family)